MTASAVDLPDFFPDQSPIQLVEKERIAIEMSVEDMDAKSPESVPTTKKSHSSSIEKKNKQNTIGKSLKMRLEIMVPPDEED
jgi:hypothetical protein